MNKRRRIRAAALAAAATAVVVVVAYLTLPTASADVLDGPSFATNRLSSDPHITRCTDPDTDIVGYCMVTSSDRGQANAYPPANYYPMTTTYLLYSPDGVNWVDKGAIAHETDIPWVPDGDKTLGEVGDAWHQWAPSLNQWGRRYYLYVPNVSNISNGPAEPNIHTSSRIAVWRSPEYDPFGPYEYRGYLSENADFGYMSDPDVLVDGSTRHVIWADGDFGNCGGFKMGVMQDYRTVIPSSVHPVVISGVGVLGDCGGTGRPYLEGASLYKFNDAQMPGPYTLVFPAKPDHVPTECTSSVGGPNSDLSVIAYATASSSQFLEGKFTYRGIIMCGSATEWTNQATITQVQAFNGRKPWVIVYHDSEANVKERKLYAECLFAGSGMIAGVYRQRLDASYGFNDCVGDGAFDFSGLHVVDGNIGSGVGKILTAPNAGADAVQVSRYAVGPWERFKVFKRSNGMYVIQSLANKKYLCSFGTATALKASCTSQTQFGAQFQLESKGTDVFWLYSTDLGEYLSMHSDGKLYPDTASIAEGFPAQFTEMKLR